ncbi:MAG: hypothetical protein OEU91_05650 [Gammaproteobacteria bacterium]|nr:hypothetical protein [Gammaproteobacteria bacterium]
MEGTRLARTAVLAIIIFFTGCDNDNTVPVADAGPDQTEGIIAGDVVILDGSGSSDADGHNLTYLWSFVSVPAGSTAEFDDATSETPAFTADLVGTYVVELVVSDGPLDSLPDEVTVIAVAPAPTVTITTPEPLSLFTETPITVEGTVDDPLATITVNGTDTPNDNGSYSATNIELVEGSNTVTVIATNSTGQGEDSVTVILKTQDGPVMSITSHRSGFTAGHVFDGCPPAEPASIPARVHGTLTTENGPPTVDVNGVTATVTELAANPLLVAFCNRFPNADICSILDNTRYSFSADIDLSVGAQTITATGTDTAGGSTSVAVNGAADYCYIAEEGVAQACPSAGNGPAVRGNNQTKRCHAVDGCSAYVFDNGPVVLLGLNNNPMPLAVHNQVPIEFGDGEVPPEEFFVHGQDPARKLGCNMHDVCYQTCVPVNQRAACDDEMYEINKAKCRQAYPATCPYTILDTDIPDPSICPWWLVEKISCFDWALRYRAGLGLLGGSAYDERQGQYCQ